MKIPADLDPTPPPPLRIPRSAPGCHSVQVSDCTRHIPYQRLRFSASSCGSTPPPIVVWWEQWRTEEDLEGTRYIPHDNTHEIYTWKCSIQTQSGSVIYSSFRRNVV